MHYLTLKILWMWCVVIPLATAPDINSGNKEEKIYGGRLASEGEFPYAVYVVYKVTPTTTKSCGGTIATLSRVISAGHCFMERQKNSNKYARRDSTKYEICGGMLDHKSENKQVRNVINFTVHEGFADRHDGSPYHDIAVAELEKPFTASSTLSVMKVPSFKAEENKNSWEQFAKSGKLCTAVGWGWTEASTPTSAVSSNLLKVAELRLWTRERCEATNHMDDEDMTDKGEVCLGQNKPGEGICQGDSGGPLICGGFVFGLSRAVGLCNEDKGQYFLLFWPYLKYFGFESAETKGSEGSAVSKSIIAYDFQSALLRLTTVILTTSML